MKREDKFKDTPTFHYYNANPKNRITGDCAFRAISTALEQDYNQTVMEMAEMMCKTGFAMNDAKGEEKYLASKGWVKHPQPRKADGSKFTGKEFCRSMAISGVNYIAHIGGHHSGHRNIRDFFSSVIHSLNLGNVMKHIDAARGSELFCLS